MNCSRLQFSRWNRRRFHVWIGRGGLWRAVWTCAVTVVAAALTGVGCRSAEHPSAQVAFEGSAAAPVVAPPPRSEPPGPGAPAGAVAEGSALPPATLHRMLVRNARVSLEVASIDDWSTELSKVAARHLGAVTEFSRQSESRRKSAHATATLVVPSDFLDRTLADLAGTGEVTEKQVTTEDHTRVYVDAGARLQAKREQAQRLRDLMAQRTGDLSDVLEVERELTRVLGEIEVLQADRRTVEQQVAESRIHLSVHETVGRPAMLDDMRATFASSVETLGASVGALAQFVAAVLPWVTAVGLVMAVVRWVQRRMRPAVVAVGTPTVG